MQLAQPHIKDRLDAVGPGQDMCPLDAARQVAGVNGGDLLPVEPLAERAVLPPSQLGERHVGLAVVALGLVSLHLAVAHEVYAGALHHFFETLLFNADSQSLGEKHRITASLLSLRPLR